MDAARWLISLVVYAAMIAACVLQFTFAGIGGLIGGVLGFAVRALWPGQSDWGERLGNGYIGSLAGMCVGFATMGLGGFIYMHLGDWVSSVAQR